MNLSELVRVPETPGHVSSTARTDKTWLVVFLTKRNSWDFPGGPVVENPPATAGNTGDGFNPWVRKIPWRRKWQPTPVFLSGKCHGQRSLAGVTEVTKSCE